MSWFWAWSHFLSYPNRAIGWIGQFPRCLLLKSRPCFRVAFFYNAANSIIKMLWRLWGWPVGHLRFICYWFVWHNSFLLMVMVSKPV